MKQTALLITGFEDAAELAYFLAFLTNEKRRRQQRKKAWRRIELRPMQLTAAKAAALKNSAAVIDSDTSAIAFLAFGKNTSHRAITEYNAPWLKRTNNASPKPAKPAQLVVDNRATLPF